MTPLKSILEDIEKEFEIYFVSIGGGTALNTEEEVIAQKENINKWIRIGLVSALKQVLEGLRMEWESPELTGNIMTDSRMDGYNQAVQDFNAKINKMLKELE